MVIEMKKRLVMLLFALCMCIVSLCACVGDTDTTTTAGSDNDSSNQATSSTASDTEPVSTSALDTLSSERREELQEIVKNNIDRALEIGDATIDKYGKRARGYMLSESYNINTGSTSGTSSVWHYTAYYAMISRLAEIAQTEEDRAAYEELSQVVYDGFEYYEGTADLITYKGTLTQTLYGVNRSFNKGTANVANEMSVYDDQMWIIRETVYRYKATGEEEYLNEAIRLAQVCIDGWDYTLDENGEEYGGIPWGSHYSTKHTCSNAPIVMPLVEIYEIKKDRGDDDAQYYLDWAIKIYDFVREHLMNINGTYGDLVGTERSLVDNTYVTTSMSSDIDHTAYTYNTGAMISGGVALYRVTGESKYLTDAKRSSIAAYSNFCDRKTVPGEYMYPINSQTTWFNLVLLQGFLDLYEFEPEDALLYIESFQKSLDYAYENYNRDGFLPRNYLSGWEDINYDNNKNVMDQASASQMYAMLAIWAQQILDADNAKLEAVS